MATASPNSPVVRFGAYEADLRTGELRKHGLRIKLQDQPFQILAMLLERPGELVTREQIQQKLWPADTFVDFDHSLNTAIRRLRDALSDSADNPRFIETLPRRGYRFIGQVPVGAPDGVQVNGVPVEPPPRPVKNEPAISYAATTAVQRYRYREAVAGLVIVAMVVGGLLFWRLWPRSANIDSVAVLPFTNATRNSDLDYLGDGIAESIMANLSQVPSLKVMSRNSAFRYRGQALDSQKIARELGVGALLLGTVSQSGDQLRVSLELVDARDRQLWDAHYDRKLADMLSLQEEISRQTAERLRGGLSGDEQNRAFVLHTANPAAYDLYLRGRHALEKRTNDNFKQALVYFQQAIDADPAYAKPYVGMAAAYGLLSFYGGMSPVDAHPKEAAAARRALELEPGSVDSHVEMAYTLSERRDWPASEQEWKRAIAIDSNSADAHHGYSMFLASRGRFDEALREDDITEKLDPLWPGSTGTTAWTLFYARRYSEAERHAQRAGSGFAPAYWVLGQVYEQRGQFKEAIEAFKKDFSIGGRGDFSEALLAHAYAMDGQKAEAKTLLADMLELRKTAYFSGFNIAAVYLALGNRPSAIAWLKKADEERDPWMQRMKYDPRLDPIRTLPEVVEIQRKQEVPLPE
jgi:TolB-like protein/DNA-binding winged helix-turn-helix (wHTH) protein